MSVFIKNILQFLILSVISLTALAASAAGVVDTKHNLAHWGPGTYTAVTEDRVCIFCHTPHNASPDGPLWSHALTAGGVTFKKYSSGTLRILGEAQASSGYVAGQITGATKLCLGCHDGLTALGAITTGRGSITITMNTDIITGSSSYKEDASTVNIQNKHPVSFNYNASVVTDITSAVGSPIPKGAVYDLPKNNTNGTSINLSVQKMVDAAGGRIECTICHDPHENKATYNQALLPFWVSGSYNDAILGNLSSYEGVCASCHSQSYGEYTGFSDYTSLR
ncbi:MAG: hypothetical protein IMF07_07625 [Proteobacteria bacterium]|nr:hypothetical protein [Pseudomonadota bacterium]